MARVWRCSCGAEFPGDTDGTAQAFGHMMGGRKREGADVHASCPLVDTETGEELMTWPNVRAAQLKGFIEKNPDSAFAKQKAKRGKAVEVKVSVPYRGRVPFKDIPIPPELYYLYILSMAEFGYDDTAEAFAEWISACVMNLHIKFPEVFGFDRFLLSAAADNGALEEFLKMAGAEAVGAKP